MPGVSHILFIYTVYATQGKPGQWATLPHGRTVSQPGNHVMARFSSDLIFPWPPLDHGKMPTDGFKPQVRSGAIGHEPSLEMFLEATASG